MFVSYIDPFNEYEYKQIISDNNIPLICLSVGNNDGIQIDEINNKKYMITAESNNTWFSNQDYVTNVYEIL